jgi:type II secretory pathway component PulC
MALFKPHTLLGKAGQWFKNSGVGQIALGAIGAVTGLGAVKVASMAVAAIRDNKIKEEEIAKTLQSSGIPVTKAAIDEVKAAIADEAKKTAGYVPATQTYYNPEIPGYSVKEWIQKNIRVIAVVVVVLGGVVFFLVKKPFGKKVGRKK